MSGSSKTSTTDPPRLDPKRIVATSLMGCVDPMGGGDPFGGGDPRCGGDPRATRTAQWSTNLGSARLSGWGQRVSSPCPSVVLPRPIQRSFAPHVSFTRPSFQRMWHAQNNRTTQLRAEDRLDALAAAGLADPSGRSQWGAGHSGNSGCALRCARWQHNGKQSVPELVLALHGRQRSHGLRRSMGGGDPMDRRAPWVVATLSMGCAHCRCRGGPAIL